MSAGAVVPGSGGLSGRHRRVATGRVRAMEYRRRAVSALEPAEFSFPRSVGRVGALAVALGVGSAVVAIPVALADRTGSAGSVGPADTADSAGSDSSSVSSSRVRPRVRAAIDGAVTGGAARPGVRDGRPGGAVPSGVGVGVGVVGVDRRPGSVVSGARVAVGDLGVA